MKNNNNENLSIINTNNINPNMSKSKLVIIKKERADSENQNKNIITLEEGNYFIKSSLDNKMNKENINKKIENMRKSIENLNNDFKKFQNKKKENNKKPKNLNDNATNGELTELNIYSNGNLNSNEFLTSVNNERIKTNTIQPSDKALKSDKISESEEENHTKIEQKTFIINNNDEDGNEGEIKDGNNIIFFQINGENVKKQIVYKIISKEYLECIVCEKTVNLKKLYCAECNKHYICRRCCKNYYEEKIENGEREFKCCLQKCPEIFDLNKLSHIISKQHYNIIIDEEKLLNKKLKIKYEEFNANLDTMKIYNEKHVLDINNNEKFFFYKKSKVYICPKCNQNSLFGKTGTHFVKCLNCLHKICKYCLKTYDNYHMDIVQENHCKVYYRKEEEEDQKKDSCIENILYEFLFLICSFLFMFIGSWYYIKNIIKFIFCLSNRKNLNCFLEFFVCLFTFIFFIPSIGTIILILPYFSILIMVFGF
jgi:hypothetical protein